MSIFGPAVEHTLKQLTITEDQATLNTSLQAINYKIAKFKSPGQKCLDIAMGNLKDVSIGHVVVIKVMFVPIGPGFFKTQSAVLSLTKLSLQF